MWRLPRRSMRDHSGSHERHCRALSPARADAPTSLASVGLRVVNASGRVRVCVLVGIGRGAAGEGSFLPIHDGAPGCARDGHLRRMCATMHNGA